MKKITTLLIILFSFFIASREVFAQDPTNCTSVTVSGYNAYDVRSISTLEKVCSYRPLGVNPSDLQSSQGITYMEIYNLENGNGDIYYFMEVNEKLSGKDYKLLACSIKKPNGEKETHTEMIGGIENRFFMAQNEVFETKIPGNYGTPGVNGGSLYELVDGFEGTSGLSYEGHDNKHICPAYAGKIYALESAYGYSEGYAAAFTATDYNGQTQWPTVADEFSNFTSAYHGGLTWHSSNATSDSVNTETGEIVDMTVVSQEQYALRHTNNTISVAATNLPTVADWESCNQYGVLKTLDIVHTAMVILRIMVPLFLIILGSIDFGKAGLSGDDDLVTKATKILVRRAILGVAIFFIPTIIYAFTNLLDDRNNTNDSSFYKCNACFTGTNECDGFIQQSESKVEIN